MLLTMTIKDFFDDLIPQEPPKVPKFNPGGLLKDYKSLEDEAVIKKLIEEQYGNISNEEFAYSMDKHYEQHGYYVDRDARGKELDLLTTYIDEYRRFGKEGR